MSTRNFPAAVLLSLLSTGLARAESLDSEVAELRVLLQELSSSYEARIDELELRLAHAERLAQAATRTADDAIDIAEQSAIDVSGGTSAANTFNPSIGAVLITRYADIDRSWEEIPGFMPGGEPGPGGPGISLGESEINMKASVDSRFFANLTLALEDSDGATEVAVEEAWAQTTALPYGMTLLGGRYFSGVGYLNGFHRHADDFADRPLPYQAFVGGQYIPDGMQVRWIAPTKLFFELGAELNWGASFPMSGRDRSSPDAWAVYATLGGDFGPSHSWQAGLSYLAADVIERSGGDEATAAGAFSGDSDLTVLDFVWKWAPGGNPTVNNFKLQGEYFWRDEQGNFDALAYNGEQRGWYLQGIWQFMPRWRIGYRHDQVGSDNGALFAGTLLEDPASDPQRDSVMIDWSPSEFSRLRLQLTDDRVLEGRDGQLLLQYLMSIGAHGAHQF